MKIWPENEAIRNVPIPLHFNRKTTTIHSFKIFKHSNIQTFKHSGCNICWQRHLGKRITEKRSLHGNVVSIISTNSNLLIYNIVIGLL